MSACTHRDHVKLDALPEAVDGCADCLRDGGTWVHLRLCLECGHVGCCDSSPGQHASAHGREAGHPVIRSIEPGETWSWCFVDEVGLRVPLEGEVRLPPPPAA